MSELQQVQIKVKAKSKTGRGVCDEAGTWYNAGTKKLSFEGIEKGDALVLHYANGNEGGKFVMKFTKVASNGAPELPAAGETSTASEAPRVSFKPKYEAKTDSDKMSKEDWAKKDLAMTKGGTLKAVAIVTASMVGMKTKEEAAEIFEYLFDRMLKKVQE